MAFRRNGDSKKRLSIVDGDPAGQIAADSLHEPEELQAVSGDASVPSFADVAQQTRSVIHELQKEWAARREPVPPALGAKTDPVPSPQSTASAPPLAHPASAAAPLAQPVVSTTQEPSKEDLERELQQYFGQSATAPPDGVTVQQSVLDGIRDKVIEGVVDRILREWSHPGSNTPTALQREVTERLIQRVIQGFGTQA